MNILRLTYANLKRYFKSPAILLSMAIMPLVLIFSLEISFSGSNNSYYLAPVGIVLNTTGEYEKKLIKDLDLPAENIFNYSQKDKAIDLVKNNELSSIFILNESFSKDINSLKKPNIECIQTNAGGGNIWASTKIETFINTSLKVKINPNINNSLITSKIIEKDNALNSGSFSSIFLICYLIYISSASLCTDILELRKSNVLKRMIATKNNDFEILFSLFFSLFLLQALVYILIILFVTLVLGSSISLNMILLVLANCFVSTGLIMFMSRVFKSEASVSLASPLFAIIGLALSMPSLIPSLDVNIPILINISKLTPFYWTLEALNSDTIFVHLVSLILIGLVFVTAGSFKLRDFAKN